MLTCFIRNNFPDHEKGYSVYFVLAIPVIYICYSVISFIRVFLNTKVNRKSPFHRVIVGYFIYSIIYFVFYLPPVILYIISANIKIERDSFISWFSFFSAICTVSINLALSLLRLIQGYGNSSESSDSLNHSAITSSYIHTLVNFEYKQFTNSVGLYILIYFKLVCG